jgi:hypothetical protein
VSARPVVVGIAARLVALTLAPLFLIGRFLGDVMDEVLRRREDRS